MTTPPSMQQLAEILAAASSSHDEASAALAGVERTAEALDADVAAIVCGDEVLAAVGYPDGAAPIGELDSVTPGAAGCELRVPGLGTCPATAVSLEHPPGARLIIARPGPAGLSRDEASLLRGIARVTSLTMRMLRLLDDERAARQQLAASRARIVAAADEARRRIERDLHDGAQQRLVTLALELQRAMEAVAPEAPELEEHLARVMGGLREVIDELREISRGVHPAILSEGGLVPALKALARRCALPVELDLAAVGRLPQPVEVAAYYVASEALANASKHANASTAEVDLELRNGTLRLAVRDDGVGGADPSLGSGLIGLSDRAETLGGTITLDSPSGEGTSMVLELPVDGR